MNTKRDKQGYSPGKLAGEIITNLEEAKQNHPSAVDYIDQSVQFAQPGQQYWYRVNPPTFPITVSDSAALAYLENLLEQSFVQK
jgi:hypothetical protein